MEASLEQYKPKFTRSGKKSRKYCKSSTASSGGGWQEAEGREASSALELSPMRREPPLSDCWVFAKRNRRRRNFFVTTILFLLFNQDNVCWKGEIGWSENLFGLDGHVHWTVDFYVLKLVVKICYRRCKLLWSNGKTMVEIWWGGTSVCLSHVLAFRHAGSCQGRGGFLPPGAPFQSPAFQNIFPKSSFPEICCSPSWWAGAANSLLCIFYVVLFKSIACH